MNNDRTTTGHSPENGTTLLAPDSVITGALRMTENDDPTGGVKGENPSAANETKTDPGEEDDDVRAAGGLPNSDDPLSE